MSNEEIKKIIKEIIIEEFELEEQYSQEDIGNNFLVEFHCNSVDVLDLLLQIENRFDIEMPDENINAEIFESIDNVVNIVQELL